MFRGVLDEVGFNNSLFMPLEVAKMHGDEKIDSRKQYPKLFSFNPQAQKSQQTCKTFTIDQYFSYQQENLQNAPKDFIYFAVNIDIANWKEHVAELEKIPKPLYCQSKYDSLNILRQTILGITTPQMYMKVNGCWTGGHMENMNLQAVNINHGIVFFFIFVINY